MKPPQKREVDAEARDDQEDHRNKVNPVRDDEGHRMRFAVMCQVRHVTSPPKLVTVSKLLPVAGSVMCTAQAVQGSKLCTVRSALIGFSMSPTGLPISAAPSAVLAALVDGSEVPRRRDDDLITSILPSLMLSEW